jgi:hypothetical protein
MSHRDALTLLGYELGTGNEVKIPLAHTAVCGETQSSGKTTTLEAYIVRLGITAVAFLTKRGEGGFRLQTEIRPFFREPEISDESPMWKWVQSIFEAMDQTVGKDEKVAIIEASEFVLERESYKQKGEVRTRLVKTDEEVETLEQVAENVRKMEVGARGKTKSALTLLNAYFKIVLPQIARLKSTSKLDLKPGINVMNLIGIPFDMQMLIIRSVVEEVYLHRRRTAVIIPECAKIIPRMRNSPVRVAAEMLTREGLAIGNVLMLDAQDLANVATEVLKSIGVWLFGKQSELNERKRSSEYIPAIPKITSDNMMQLGKGEFYAVFGGGVKKVYVMPAGMEPLHARAIARGELDASSWSEISRRLDREPKGQIANEEAEELAEAMSEEYPEDESVYRHPGLMGTDSPRLINVKEGFDDEESNETLSDAVEGETASQEIESLNSPMGPSGGDRDRLVDSVEYTSVAIADIEESEGEEMSDRKSSPIDEYIASLQDCISNLVSAIDADETSTPSQLRALKVARALLPGSTSKDNSRATPANGHAVAELPLTPAFDYEQLKRRLFVDPAILAMLDLQRPMLEITVKKPRIDWDHDSTQGRIAKLIHEGFFKLPVNSRAILTEFKRRAWIREKAGYAELIKPMKQISELGFLTIENGGYQAAPGMKINVKEA